MFSYTSFPAATPTDAVRVNLGEESTSRQNTHANGQVRRYTGMRTEDANEGTRS